MNKLLIASFIILFVYTTQETYEEFAKSCIEEGDETLVEKTCTERKSVNKEYSCCYLYYRLGNQEFRACTPTHVTKKELKEYTGMLEHTDELDLQCKESFQYMNYLLYILIVLSFCD